MLFIKTLNIVVGVLLASSLQASHLSQQEYDAVALFQLAKEPSTHKQQVNTFSNIQSVYSAYTSIAKDQSFALAVPPLKQDMLHHIGHNEIMATLEYQEEINGKLRTLIAGHGWQASEQFKSFRKLFLDKNETEIKRLQKLAHEVLAWQGFKLASQQNQLSIEFFTEWTHTGSRLINNLNAFFFAAFLGDSCKISPDAWEQFKQTPEYKTTEPFRTLIEDLVRPIKAASVGLDQEGMSISTALQDFRRKNSDNFVLPAQGSAQTEKLFASKLVMVKTKLARAESIMKEYASIEEAYRDLKVHPHAPMTPHEMYATFEPQNNWFLNYLQHPEKICASVEKLSGLPRRLEVMWRGGMPGTIGLPQEALPAYFSSYIQTYVERDVRTLENIEDAATFGRFLGLLGALTSQEINISHLGRELGIVPKTAERWLRLLTYTYQWHELPAFHGNAVKRIIMKPKGIISDTGLACFLQRISSPDALGMSLLQGGIFESFCFNMLKGFCSALPMMPNFYHWRTGAGAEVDIIVELNGRLYPIEVKSTTNVTGHDARGITAFRDTYPHLNIATGVIIYAGDICYPVTEHVIAVPWDAK